MIAAAFAVPASADIKIGYVNYARLFDESPQAKVVTDSLRGEFQPRQQQIVTQEQALKTRGEKLQKDVATMTPDQRSKAEKDMRDAARDLERKKAELEDDFNARRQEEMGKLQNSLINEVQNYAKSQNYDLVIAQGVIYATPQVDITSAVLNALQARAPASPAPAPAKPAAKP